MRRTPRWPLLLPALLIAACQPPGGTPADAAPTPEEVVGYLDGKPLPLAQQLPADRAGAEEKPKVVTMRKESISGLAVKSGVRPAQAEPWISTVNFFYAEGKEKYAVEGTVDHKKVDQQRAFFGFRVKRVARQ